MRTETRTVRIGEWLGPVDWSYDFASHDWNHGGGTNPDHVSRCVSMLRELDEGIARGEVWEATTDGGIPRVGWGRVLDIGMYDGWPYWRPVPSVLIDDYLGAETTSYCGLSEIRKASNQESRPE